MVCGMTEQTAPDAPATAAEYRAQIDAARMSVAASVRAELAREGVRQIAIASLLGKPPSAITLRWRGKRSWQAEELALISREFNIPAGRLLGDVINP